MHYCYRINTSLRKSSAYSLLSIDKPPPAPPLPPPPPHTHTHTHTVLSGLPSHNQPPTPYNVDSHFEDLTKKLMLPLSSWNSRRRLRSSILDKLLKRTKTQLTMEPAC